MITRVSDDLYKTCYTFSEDNAKKLMVAYSKAEEKDANCDSELRSIIHPKRGGDEEKNEDNESKNDDNEGNNLQEAVKTLQNAAANIWQKREQLFILKAR